MAERSHLPIGEVLSLLREEFPDVTISKIRFLESQGLVDPERTPSGYRKFYENDIERLRWILRQQRENFLPLKIIRGRLTEHGDDLDEPYPDVVDPGAGGLGDDDAAPAPELAGASDHGRAAPDPAKIEAASAGHPSGGTRPRKARDPAVVASAPKAAAGQPPIPAGAAGGGADAAGPGPGAPTVGGKAATPNAATAKSAPAPAGSQSGPAPAPEQSGAGRARRVPAAGAAAGAGGGGEAIPGVEPALVSDVETYSLEELAEAAGGTVAMVVDLQQFGLIGARTVVGGTPYFDRGALDVARAAAGFSHHGVEARHLRAWRNAADREAGLFEQVILPLLRQRNPEARRQAAITLSELTSLGGDLRQALIEQAVRQIH